MFTRAFARDLAERTIATFAEALAAVLIADGAGVLEASWRSSLSVAAMAALVTLLKGVAAARFDEETGASLLTSPPPKVAPRHRDGGHVDLATVLLVGILVVLVLVLAGFFR